MMFLPSDELVGHAVCLVAAFETSYIDSFGLAIDPDRRGDLMAAYYAGFTAGWQEPDR